MKVLCLAGLKHVGKSYYGQILAQKYAVTFIDLDQECEAVYRMPIAQIYKNLGKEAFHKLELSVLKQLCYDKPSLIALGGATLLNVDNLEFLKTKGDIVVLESCFDNIKKRILEAKTLWAALDSSDIEGSLKKLYEQRTQYYQNLGFKSFKVDDQDQMIQLGAYVGQFFW